MPDRPRVVRMPAFEVVRDLREPPEILMSHPAYGLGYQHGFEDAPSDRNTPAHRAERRAAFVRGILVGAFALATVNLVILAASTPRSAPATTPPPGASGTDAATGDAVPLRVRASTSPGPTEAPTGAEGPLTSGPEEATTPDPPRDVDGGASILARRATRTGIAAYAVPGHGSRYLAIPEGPGLRVRVCARAHPERCIDRTSTDAGPELALQRAGRVADLSFVDFAALCRCDPPAVGLLQVSIEYLERAAPTPPATDVQH